MVNFLYVFHICIHAPEHERRVRVTAPFKWSITGQIQNDSPWEEVNQEKKRRRICWVEENRKSMCLQ